MTSLENLRENYQRNTLDIQDVAISPIQQFEIWFQQALESEIKEPNAMILATANAEGFPSARTVLLKGVSEKGFVFYTNYNSQKGTELAANPNAALLFLWLDLQRQIRIEGKVERLSFEESERYFQSRPKGSQIGAWASPQSQVIDDRSILKEKVEALKVQYAEVDQLPCPPHWGGFIVQPKRIEFWQGRPNRLHDRVAYQKQEEGKWKIERLAP